MDFLTLLKLGSTKDNAIINKEEVINSGTTTGYFDTLDPKGVLYITKEGIKSLSINETEVRGYRIPLKDASRRFNNRSGLAIDKNRVRNSSYTSHDPRYPHFIKPNFRIIDSRKLHSNLS